MHWLTYFADGDCEVAIDRAEQLGGTVGPSPRDIAPGPFAIL